MFLQITGLEWSNRIKHLSPDYVIGRKERVYVTEPFAEKPECLRPFRSFMYKDNVVLETWRPQFISLLGNYLQDSRKSFTVQEVLQEGGACFFEPHMYAGNWWSEINESIPYDSLILVTDVLLYPLKDPWSIGTLTYRYDDAPYYCVIAFDTPGWMEVERIRELQKHHRNIPVCAKNFELNWTPAKLEVLRRRLNGRSE